MLISPLPLPYRYNYFSIPRASLAGMHLSHRSYIGEELSYFVRGAGPRDYLVPSSMLEPQPVISRVPCEMSGGGSRATKMLKGAMGGPVGRI